MRNIKLTVEYDGTNFYGWQTQAHNRRTVQTEIEKALTLILQKQIRIHGSGRTDTGVHALGQVANFRASLNMACPKLLRALNANLPDDISILAVEDVDDAFHARFSVKSKCYRYTILNRTAKPAQLRNFCLWHPYKLSIPKMREGARYLLGRKDFRSFQASDALRKGHDTVRTVKSLKISKRGDLITIEITATGFLYKMVRNIVGTLLDVGHNTLEPKDLHRILKAKDRRQASKTAKPEGLCLVEVSY